MVRRASVSVSAATATRLIRARARISGNVLLTLHAQEQMQARDLIAPEVFRILREGTVHDTPVREGDEWKAVIELTMPGGRRAATVTVLAANDRLRVVTVMWRSR